MLKGLSWKAQLAEFRLRADGSKGLGVLRAKCCQIVWQQMEDAVTDSFQKKHTHTHIPEQAHCMHTLMCEGVKSRHTMQEGRSTISALPSKELLPASICVSVCAHTCVHSPHSGVTVHEGVSHTLNVQTDVCRSNFFVLCLCVTSHSNNFSTPFITIYRILSTWRKNSDFNFHKSTNIIL